MKIGIMQPYFAPYIGYISLIKHTDLFILLDTVQFMRHGWIERNRVLKQNEGWLYVQIPLEKHSRDALICDTQINNAIQWKEKLLAQLIPYKKKAPFYYKVIAILNELFESEYSSIVTLNKKLLELICQYLGFPKELPVFSEMGLSVEPADMPDEWALNICKAISQDQITYINPIGGLSFFDRDKYLSANINIYFQQMEITPYNQKREIFEPGLSILDVMMFNTVDEINTMLDNFKLV